MEMPKDTGLQGTQDQKGYEKKAEASKGSFGILNSLLQRNKVRTAIHFFKRIDYVVLCICFLALVGCVCQTCKLARHVAIQAFPFYTCVDSPNAYKECGASLCTISTIWQILTPSMDTNSDSQRRTCDNETLMVCSSSLLYLCVNPILMGSVAKVTLDKKCSFKVHRRICLK